MQTHTPEDVAKQYSVTPTQTSNSNALTLEEIDRLAINLNSDKSKILTANEYIIREILTNAYMGRAYECIHSNINTSYNLVYPELEDGDSVEVLNSVKKEIDSFNEFINLKNLIVEAVSGTIREGNYSMYLRLKKESANVLSAIVDHYPLKLCYPSDYQINGEDVMEFDINSLRSSLNKTYQKVKRTNKALYFQKIDDEIENNFPEEVFKGHKDKETVVRLDEDFSGNIKINSMGRKYGVSPFFKALPSLVVLDNIEEADVADSKTRRRKIIFQKLRKELLGNDGTRKGYAEMEYAHGACAQALQTKMCLYTAPAYVEDLNYVVDKSTNDHTADTVKIYTTKLLTAIGINFVDSELSSFAVANLSAEQLMRMINSISNQLERIMHKFYMRYLEAIGLPSELAPTISIIDCEMMDLALKKEFASFIYSTLGASRETTFNMLGLDVEDEKTKRKKENAEQYDVVFHPRPTDYNTSTTTTTDASLGRPPSAEDKEQQMLDQNYNKEAR